MPFHLGVSEVQEYIVHLLFDKLVDELDILFDEDDVQHNVFSICYELNKRADMIVG